MEKRAVIYIRVSDPSQLENNSLDTQEKACRGFAKSKGYEVIEPIFNEGAGSAKHTHTRPILRQVLSFCSTKKNRVDALIVYKLDRFSRNLEDGLAAITYLARYKVEVLSVSEPVEQGPIGKALRNIMLTLAELDNELKGERVRDNMQSAFRKGLWVFKCPIGYQRKYKTKEENKGIPPIPVPNLAPIISKLFVDASSGLYNKSQLARIMNSSGFADKYSTDANHKIVDEILSKTFYYGNMYAKKWDEYAVGKHQPLTDKDTWQKAYQRVILKKKNYVYQDDTDYPLKGLLKCELCNELMTTSPSRGRGGIVYYYECKNKKCRKVRIQSKKAHTQFRQYINAIKPTQEVVKLFNHLLFLEWDKVIDDSQRRGDELEERIYKLKNEIKGIRKATEKGIYNDQEAKEEADNIRKEIAVLEIEKSEIRFQQYDTEIVKEFTEHFLLNLDLLWEKLDLPKKQALQTKIFPNGISCTKNKEIRTNDLSPSFQLIEALRAEKGENVTPCGIEPQLLG